MRVVAHLSQLAVYVGAQTYIPERNRTAVFPPERGGTTEWPLRGEGQGGFPSLGGFSQKLVLAGV